MASKEYTLLFNAVLDAINLLVKAQQEAEEEIISEETDEEA